MDWMGADPSLAEERPFAKSPLWSVARVASPSTCVWRRGAGQDRRSASQKCLLYRPIRHGRDAQHALTTIEFWDRYPASKIMRLGTALDRLRNG